MDILFANTDIKIFMALFRSREDIFAKRWEKDKKSGYIPVYSYDIYMYRLHKMNGGNFQNYKDKTYFPLTEEQVAKHLNGGHHIGVYPLLKDNTSWFIVADFDKDKWVEECRIFIKACHEKNLPVYLERSRSGKGGHVWLFFEKPYPAIKSRKIIKTILEQTGLFSIFDKSASFDRLFPNQDYLSGKGFGNLIALPLYKHTFNKGNSCFINQDSFEPFPDQWQYIKNIQRISIEKLDELYNSITKNTFQNSLVIDNSKPIYDKVSIKLNNAVSIARAGLNISVINFLKDELNFANSEFLIKKKLGKNTFGDSHYYKFIEEKENEIIIPRGFIGQLIRYCKEQKIDFEFQDERTKLNSVSFTCNVQLRDHQKEVVEASFKKDIGIIVSPPGSGKTIIGLKIISEKQQPALIIVHRKQLAEQWIERIQSFLNIPKNEIGRIGQGKTKLGKKITVALIQSLTKEFDKQNAVEICNAFGTIIVDECHHIPAESYKNTIAKLKTFYLYGLTATPFRKYNDGKLIFIHLGEIFSEIKSQAIGTHKKPIIIIRNTELDIPFNSRTDNFETLSKALVHDTTRNKLILEDITKELANRKKIVIITERKEHIDSLYQYLKQSYETITLSGDDSENNRNAKWKILKDGSYQVLITTGQLFGEGTDLQNAQCLFLVYPFSFKGKLIQYIGRVQRSEVTPIIYDYRDYKIDYLNKLFLKRNTYYRKIEAQASLFDDLPNEATDTKEILKIEERIKLPIDDLEFRYGTIAFKYYVNQTDTEIEFELENTEIRPEFDVLKPHFEKILKTRNVVIDIHAEFQNMKLIAQLATSSDLDKINREMIESVKFRFIEKNILGKKNNHSNENLLDIHQIQLGDKINSLLYNSGEELLEDILKNEKVKHYRQLRYLSFRHES